MYTIDLSGRNAVITGGGRGIGFGCARVLADAGARIVITELDGARADDAVGRLPGDGHLGIAADAARPESHAEVAARVVDELGGLDIWMNNAGMIVQTPLTATPSDWSRGVDLMLSGVFFGCQAAGQRMRDDGAIVNVASMGSFRALAPGSHSYIAAKSGVMGLTRSMALELAPRGIRVNAVAPGFVQTEGTQEFGAANPDTEGMIDLLPIPLGRQGEPADIARVVLFLVSDLARYVTGTTVPVDGGFLAM